MTTRSTLVAIKLKSTRGTRQAFALALIILGIAGLIGMIGVAQVLACRHERGLTTSQCIQEIKK